MHGPVKSEETSYWCIAEMARWIAVDFIRFVVEVRRGEEKACRCGKESCRSFLENIGLDRILFLESILRRPEANIRIATEDAFEMAGRIKGSCPRHMESQIESFGNVEKGSGTDYCSHAESFNLDSVAPMGSSSSGTATALKSSHDDRPSMVGRCKGVCISHVARARDGVPTVDTGSCKIGVADEECFVEFGLGQMERGR